MAIVELHQVSLCVRDLERALRFYRDVLGCRLVGDLAYAGAASSQALGLAATEFRSALLERDGMRLELIAFASGTAAQDQMPRADRPGLSHLTFLVDDLRATLQSLRDQGVPAVDGTQVEHAVGSASCLVRDPDGQLVLLVQQPAGVAQPRPARRAPRGS
jgi:lactoylglutathione lyase